MNFSGKYVTTRASARALGARFRRAAEAAFIRAGESPAHGKPGIGGTRRLLMRGFPFAVVYLDSDHEVTIYAVAHLSRSPHYWDERLSKRE